MAKTNMMAPRLRQIFGGQNVLRIQSRRNQPKVENPNQNAYRSPLIIAVIFITFFHNVLSRHKIRHFKDRFKRQQGANLYLPGSFVTDNNDPESGAWEEWSAPGPCSRTCGGGVSTQIRRCTQGYDCRGPSARSFSCNTQDCPDLADYRAQQCAEHNNVPFEGMHYEWVPYTKGPNPCELNCMPRGERFYYRHADAVVDGTTCTDEGFDVCVQGKCQPVGCDRMLGSSAREDECRVCGGDGSTCRTFTNTIQMKDMQMGYNDILLIPAGATNIRVEELAPSSNYLAIRNTSAHFYLNGNWRIDFPRATDFAGTRFKYERTPQEFDAPDIITALGPTDESLFIVLLYEGSDVPVSFSYSLPTSVPPPPNETYSWIYDEFLPCTVTCGKGIQYRNVSCAGRNSLEPVPESLCDSHSKPEDVKTCSEIDCLPEWYPSDWSDCSVPCGEEGGVQTRKLVCQKLNASGVQEVVSGSDCFGQSKPPTEMKCNVQKQCPKWYIEPWKPCDHLCGAGKQTRKITCYKEENNRKTILPDAECDAVEKKPSTEQPCNLRPCEGVDWVTSEWSGCGACGLTQETRKVLCATEDSEVQPDELCDADRKPQIIRECEMTPCQYLWYASQWSECSVTCGAGVQTRTIICGISTPTGVETVDDSKCDPSKNFETMRNCTGEKEKCDGEWFTGPMGECSKPCGGGTRSRKLICIRDGQVADSSACGSDKIVFADEKCNETPCSEDTILPTDITQSVDESEPTKESSQKREATTPLSSTSEDLQSKETEVTSAFEMTTTSSVSTTPNPDDFEIVPDTNCDDGEWVEDEEEEPKMQGDDPFAYDDVMMGDQPVEGSGDTTESSTDTSIFTETSISTEPSVSTEKTVSSTTPEPEVLIESDLGRDVTSTTQKSAKLPDSTDTTLEFTGSTESPETTIEYTGSTEAPESTTEYTGSTEAPESTTEYTGSTEAPESTTEYTGSTEAPESTTEYTGSTEAPESTTEYTGSTEAPESTTEYTGSTEAPESTTEYTGSTEAPESTTEYTGSTEAPESTTEYTGSTEAPESTTEYTGSTEAPESTTEYTGSTEAPESTTEYTGSTEAPESTTEYTGSTEAPESTTEYTGSTEAPESTTEYTGSTEAPESTTEYTGSTEAPESTTEYTGSTEAPESTTEYTGSTEAPESTTEYTGSTEAPESTTEYTGSTEAPESTTEYTGSTEAPESTTEYTGSTEAPESTTEYTGSTEVPESTTEYTGSTEAPESTTEYTGSTEAAQSTTEYTGSTEAPESTTEYTGSTEAPESTTEYTGSTEAPESTTEYTGSTEAPESTTEYTGSTEAPESTTEYTGSTEVPESTTEFTGSTESPSTTVEFTGSTESPESTAAPESTTEYTGSTEASESTTEFTGSTEAPESTTEFTGSTEASESTTEFTGSTEAPESTTEFTGSTEVPSSSTEFTGSTEAPESTTEFTGSTEASDTTTEFTGSTEASESTTEFTGSTEAPESTTEFTGSTEAPESTTEFTGSTEAPESTTEFTGSTEAPESTVEFTGSTESTVSSESTELTGSTSEFTGSTESTSEFTGSTESTTEFTGSTESTSEFTGSTESTSEFTGSTESTTEFTGSTESSTAYTGSTESTTEFTGSTESTIDYTGSTESSTSSVKDLFLPKPRLCRRRKIKKCKSTPFGCCWDNITPAQGPFDKGCPMPETCKESKYGCCDDGVSAALGPNNAGCPSSHCKETLFGCCPDNKTPSEGNDNEGCPPACFSSRYGCCNDNSTEATGPKHKGCPESTTTPIPTTEYSTTEGTTESAVSTESEETTTSISTTEFSTETTLPADCRLATYRCCPDGVTTATGPGYQGCGLPCSDSKFGCCQDGKTPAHGPSGEGCCLNSTFGCCPDDITPASGPNQADCGCERSPYGCCPDNKTAALGYYNYGCGCQYSANGCCPDRVTPAAGPDFDGCLCHTFQFGCCPDGITPAEGPRGQGCGCRNTEFGCCSDEKTPASGPNNERCTCEYTKFGCCSDGVTEAKGENFEGCAVIPQNLQVGCTLVKEKGPCRNYTVKWFFDTEYGGCSRFWYGGCEGNANRYKTKEECEEICVEPQGADRCNLPKISGPCEGYYRKYYYDKELKTCTQFVYGGCLGNNNRFETREECMNLCAQDQIQDPCQQKKDQGPCQGKHQRFYYDKELAQCQEFTYGGCKGNNNNFITMEACKQQCAPAGERKDICSLPKYEGNCTEVNANWYYDSSRKNCAPFYYTGCYGNLNNFETKEACQADCPSEVEKDICILPADTGECDRYVDRWYYDTKAQSCKQFYYGSCGGNGNNFQTQQRCQERCESREAPTATAAPAPIPTEEPRPAPETPAPFVIDMCFLPSNTGPCRNNIGNYSYFYDSRDGVCKEFVYGGCESNGNNFKSVEECLQKCGAAQDLCSLPPVQGPCNGQYSQYYYDPATDSCQIFTYGGCTGNYNRFQDQRSCEERCKRVREPEPTYTQAPPTAAIDVTVCSLPYDSGNCTDRFTAFYYNKERRTCLPFIYNGCGGNSNRFNSEEQCQRQCGEFRSQDVCNMERDPGPCRGYFIKYYYDKGTRRCEQFAYGGCRGNGNRFSSEDECAQICITHEEKKPNITAAALCRLPVDRGSCNEDYHKRWYFDDYKGDCIAFIYSGCGGNFNNFKSYQNCIDSCRELLLLPEPQPTTNLPTPTCQETFNECTTLRCAYGVEPYVDENECNRCRCREPCANVDCLPDEQCTIDINRNKVSAQDADFIAICRQRNKPGTCPRLEITDNCERECNTDADCALQMKCCNTGCGTACVDPPGQLVTQNLPAYTEGPTESPFMPPHVDPVQYKPEVAAPIGDQATLRCAVSGNPNPKIRWSKDNIEIDGTQPRYRIKLDQTLQIITLHKTDSGIYLCTASNGIGEAITSQVKLEVLDSEPRPVTILSEPGDDQPLVVSLNAPTTLNCFVLGHPFPAVTWWKDESMIPFKNSEFEIRKDYSLLIHSVDLHNLGIYTCQAYNGYGKAASWSVTVKTRGPVRFHRPEDQMYSKWIVNDDEPTTTTAIPVNPLTPPPDWEIPNTPYNPDIPPYTEPSNEIIPNTLPDAQGGRPPPSVSVPVRAEITNNDQRYPVGSDIELPCEFAGYPTPQVQWFKDGVELYQSDKIRIAETERLSVLSIEQATNADSGTYQCEATNAYSKSSSSLVISIEGMHIHPSCTDNQFFANCALIVKAKYCTHKYYAKFCCRSCTEAGLLPIDGPHIHKFKRHNTFENNLV